MSLSKGAVRRLVIAVGFVFFACVGLSARAGMVTTSLTFKTFNTGYPPDSLSSLTPSTSAGVMSLLGDGTVQDYQNYGIIDWVSSYNSSFYSSVSWEYGSDFTPLPPLNRESNAIDFIPADPSDVKPGDDFKLGTFSVKNGYWYSTGTVADVTFQVTTHSDVPSLDGHTFDGTWRMFVFAPGDTDPVNNADYFYLLERPDLGSIRVFETYAQPADNPGCIGSVDLYARIGSLVPSGFANPTAGAFLSPMPGSPAAVVPEPSTFWLLSMSLGLLPLKRLVRKKGSSR